MRKKIIFSLFLFLLLQLILLLAYFWGQNRPLKSNLFLGKEIGEFESKPLLWSRANFDGVHYLSIARNGYGYAQQAFFPLYPLLIHFIEPLFGSYLLSGIAISCVSFLGLIFIWQLLLEKAGISQKNIREVLLVFILFPTSFYFLSVYTESLFLFLVFLSFFFSSQKKWFLAALAAALASGTRVVGIFLFPSLLWEYWQERRGKKLSFKFLKDILSLGISILGLAAYMVYLKMTTGDWFYFASVQSSFKMERTTRKLVLLPQVFWRYLKMIFTVNPHQWLYLIIWWEFIVALSFLCLLLWAWRKRKEYKISESWLIFSFLSYLLPTLTGTFSSLPRYVLVCFPVFMSISYLMEGKRKFCLKTAYLVVSLFWLLVFSSFFFRGYWVG